MRYWDRLSALSRLSILCSTLLIGGNTGLAEETVGRLRNFEPTERAEKELQRAREIASALDIRPLNEPHCMAPSACDLFAPDIGNVGFTIHSDGTLRVSGISEATGEVEATICTWVVALLTEIEDLGAARAIASGLIDEVRATKEIVTITEFGADLIGEWRFDKYVKCRGVRP